MRDSVARTCELQEAWDASADYDVMMDDLECDAHGEGRALPPMGSARSAALAVGQYRLGMAVALWIGSRSDSGLIAENRRLAREIERLKKEVDMLRHHALRAAPPLSDTRRREVAAFMSEAVGECFGDRLQSLAWSPETDPASTATHELAIHVDRSGLTPEQFAAAASSLHLALVRRLAENELHSVSLVVEPLPAEA